MLKKWFPLVVLVLVGCVGGQTSSHTVGRMALDLQTATPVAVGVWEEREDVLNGEREPSWIGLQRSLYGIPYGVQTTSGKALAEDLSSWLVENLERAGIDAQEVSISLGSDRQDAVRALAQSGRPRLMLLRVDDWYADTYNQTTLHYDLTLDVLDARGSTVASTSLSGQDDLGPKQREGRRSTTEATVDIMRTLLSRDPVVEALSSSDLAGEDRSCTVEQILQMRESGLTEDQIKAACSDDD